MSAAGQNLAVICAAIDSHAKSCDFPAIEVRLASYEHDRLGWDEIKGIPVIADPDLPTGRFKIVCNRPSGHGARERQMQKPLAA